MFIKTIPKRTKENLAILGKNQFMQDFYLAGGTGIALQLGHRISDDLDFFTSQPINTQDLKDRISSLGSFTITQETENTLSGIFNKMRISFFSYRYPLLFPLKKLLKINLADVSDIVCMKIAAISARGKKKDFVDLYFVCKRVKDLPNILNIFKKKHKKINYNKLHLLKSLTYFEDADRDPPLKMLVKTDWTKVKNFFQEETKRIVNL